MMKKSSNNIVLSYFVVFILSILSFCLFGLLTYDVDAANSSAVSANSAVSKGVGLSSSSANVSSNASYYIAVSNKFEIIEGSDVMKDLQLKVQGVQMKYQKEEERIRAVLQNKYQELESKKNVLSTAEQEQRINEISKLSEQRQEKNRKYNELMNKAYETAINAIAAAYNKAVKKVAEAKGVQFVLDSSAVIYSKDNVNLGVDVLHAMNGLIKTVDFNVNIDQFISNAGTAAGGNSGNGSDGVMIGGGSAAGAQKSGGKVTPLRKSNIKE